MKNTNKLYNTKTKLEYFLNNENLAKITKNSLSTKKKPVIKNDEKKEINSLSSDIDEDENDNTMKTLIEINKINSGKLKTALKIINDMFSVSKNDGEMFLFKKLNLIVEDSIKASECLLNQANNFYNKLVQINLTQTPSKIQTLEDELSKMKEKYMSVVVLNTEYQRKIDLLEQESKLNKSMNRVNKTNIVTPSEIESIQKINKHLKSKFESKLGKYENDALSTQEKLSVLHLVISDLINKSEKDAEIIKNLSSQSGQKFDLSKDKIILHKSYFINEDNHFALVSDNEKKVYQWIDVNNANNNKVKSHINEVTDVLKDLMKYKKRSQELDLQCENLKKTYIDEIELREKEIENNLIMKKYVEESNEIKFSIFGKKDRENSHYNIYNTHGRFDTFSKNEIYTDKGLNEQLIENDLKLECTDIYETGNCSAADEKKQNLNNDLFLKDANYHGLINKSDYKYKTRSKGSISNDNLDVFINKNERGEKGDKEPISSICNVQNNNLMNKKQNTDIELIKNEKRFNKIVRSDNKSNLIQNNVSNPKNIIINKPNINFANEEDDNEISMDNKSNNKNIINEKEINTIKKASLLINQEKLSDKSLKELKNEISTIFEFNTNNKSNNFSNIEIFSSEIQNLLINIIDKLLNYDNILVRSNAKINSLEFERENLKKKINENSKINILESSNYNNNMKMLDENDDSNLIKLIQKLSQEFTDEYNKYNEFFNTTIDCNSYLNEIKSKINLNYKNLEKLQNEVIKNNNLGSNISSENSNLKSSEIVVYLKSFLKEKENTILNLCEYVNILSTEYKKISLENSSNLRRIENVNTEKTDLKNELGLKINQNISLEKNIEDLKLKNEKLSNDISKYKEELKNIELKSINTLKCTNEAEEQINQNNFLNREIKDYKEQVDLLKNKLREISDECDENKKLLRNEENLNVLANSKIKELEKSELKKSELIQKLHEKIQIQDEEILKLRHQTDSDYITIQNNILAINKLKENEEMYLQQISYNEEIKKNLISDKQNLIDELREIEKSNFMLSASLSNANKLVEKKSGLIEKMITDPNLIDELALSTGKKFDNSAILSRPYMSNLISAYEKEYKDKNNEENDEDDLIENFNTFYCKTNNNLNSRIKTNEKIDYKTNDKIDLDQYNSDNLCNEDFNIETNDNLFDRNNYIMRENMNEIVMNTNFTYKSNFSNTELKLMIQNIENFQIIPTMDLLLNYGFSLISEDLKNINAYKFLDFSQILKSKANEAVNMNIQLKESKKELIENFNLKEIALTNKINELYTEISENKNLIDKLKSRLSITERKEYDLKNNSMLEDIENIIQNSNEVDDKNNEDEYNFSGKFSDVLFNQDNNINIEENKQKVKNHKNFFKSNNQSENFNDGKNEEYTDKDKDNHGSVSSQSFILNNQLHQKISELKNEIEYLKQENVRIDIVNTNMISLNESLEASLKQVSENYEFLLNKENDVRIYSF